MDTILELAKFNHLKYFDAPHKYYNDKGEEYVSATTFIKKFKKELTNCSTDKNLVLKIGTLSVIT